MPFNGLARIGAVAIRAAVAVGATVEVGADDMPVRLAGSVPFNGLACIGNVTLTFGCGGAALNAVGCSSAALNKWGYNVSGCVVSDEVSGDKSAAAGSASPR
jgi:hypothetical protein